MNLHRIVLSVFLSILFSCGKDDSKGPNDSLSPDENGERKTDGTSFDFSVTGTLNLPDASHVYVLAPENFSTNLAEVNENGEFAIGVEKSKPYCVVFIDSTKTGADMVVGKFSSGSLNSLALGNAEAGEINIGSLAIPTGLIGDDSKNVESSKSFSEIIGEFGLSESTAETLGSVDDIIGRYANPDVDNNGKIDGEEGSEFPLDFHNRFVAVKEDNSNYTFTDLKNAFLPNDANIKYQSTGIIPKIDKDKFDTEGKEYSWTFQTATILHANACKNGPADTEELPANTPCIAEALDSFYSNQQAINVQDNPPEGDYKLEVGDHTFTWTGIKFSNLTSPTGFLAIFVKYNVDSNDKLQSISYKFQVKSEDGEYRLATQEEIDLIVKKDSSSVSLKVDGHSDDVSIGFNIPLKPEGEMKLKDITSQSVQGLDVSDVQKGVEFSRFQAGAGISYDDKLGMRFFF